MSVGRTKLKVLIVGGSPFTTKWMIPSIEPWGYDLNVLSTDKLILNGEFSAEGCDVAIIETLPNTIDGLAVIAKLTAEKPSLPILFHCSGEEITLGTGKKINLKQKIEKYPNAKLCVMRGDLKYIWDYLLDVHQAI